MISRKLKIPKKSLNLRDLMLGCTVCQCINNLHVYLYIDISRCLRLFPKINPLNHVINTTQPRYKWVETNAGDCMQGHEPARASRFTEISVAPRRSQRLSLET
jgi:hypothetical protein